uniref:Dedicator of cytokinesis protein 1 (Trinotate prediction) n=1 Tax=Henneguya salminicola TaxID=69463 RepID=A0A6G3ME12_HENSL
MIEFHTRIHHHEMIQVNLLRLLRFNEMMDAHTEAAICYLRLSEYYQWDFITQIPALLNLEPSTPGQRKEFFLNQAVQLFEKSFNLEMAIECCKALLPLHEKHIIDFMKLSEMHRHISSLLEQITTGASSLDNYFRFNFIGMDFPQAIRNKSFMCHAGSCATLGNTMSFLKKQFPNAIIPMTSTFDQQLAINNVQYIFVQVLQSLPQDKELYDKCYKASESISRYYKNFNVIKFQGTATIENKKEKAAGQPMCTFIKTVCTLKYSLPNVIMVSPIIDEQKSIITELDQNIEIVSTHSNELLDLCRNIEFNSNLIKNIQMKTSGCLNAFVNGGLATIIPKYFSDTYLLSNPNDDTKVEQLRDTLFMFMNANTEALKILVDGVSDAMVGFVINLVESYQTMRDILEKKVSTIDIYI